MLCEPGLLAARNNSDGAVFIAGYAGRLKTNDCSPRGLSRAAPAGSITSIVRKPRLRWKPFSAVSIAAPHSAATPGRRKRSDGCTWNRRSFLAAGRKNPKKVSDTFFMNLLAQGLRKRVVGTTELSPRNRRGAPRVVKLHAQFARSGSRRQSVGLSQSRLDRSFRRRGQTEHSPPAATPSRQLGLP
jgi:hypothetical protein